jgi:hypothetical protein
MSRREEGRDALRGCEKEGTDMKRKLLVLFAIVVVLSVTIAGPALACEPLRGEMELDLNPGFAPGPKAECPERLTWSGTIDFGNDLVYGIAYFPTADPVIIADTANDGEWFIFQEDWTIFTLPGDDENISLLEAACDSDRVVLEGQDVGMATPLPPPFDLAFALGSLSAVYPDVDPCGPFDESFEGGTLFWSGRFANELETEFAGAVRIFPADDHDQHH